MNQFTGQGLLVRFEERHVGQNGHRVAAGTIVLSAPRRKNKATGQWESQGEGTFLDFEAWNLSPAKIQFLSANVKNALVYVAGALRQDRWQSKDGSQKSKMKVAADVVDAKIKPSRRDSGGTRGQDNTAYTQKESEPANISAGGVVEDIPF